MTEESEQRSEHTTTHTTHSTEQTVVRTESFEASGPLDVDVTVGPGDVRVVLTGEPGASVQLRHQQGGTSPWVQGFASLMSWVNEQFTDQGGGSDGSPEAAVQQTRVGLSGGRLVVRAPKAMPLRGVPLAVVVRAPSGSNVTVHSGTADVTVTGSAGRLDVSTGSGDVGVDRADATASVTTGSGSVRLGPMLGGLRARTGSGDMEVSSVGGATSLTTGTGDVWLGAVAGDVLARTGSGDLVVADAGSGRIELTTGTGEIRVGIRQGVTAEVDLSSGTGKATSELAVSSQPPSEPAAVRLRGRTGAGIATVTTAAD